MSFIEGRVEIFRILFLSFSLAPVLFSSELQTDSGIWPLSRKFSNYPFNQTVRILGCDVSSSALATFIPNYNRTAMSYCPSNTGGIHTAFAFTLVPETFHRKQMNRSKSMKKAHFLCIVTCAKWRSNKGLNKKGHEA